MPSLPRSVRAVTMRMSLMLICVALLAGVFAISAAGQTPAENSGWWQIPTADLAYGPPLCIDFDAGGVAWIGTRGGVNMVQADGARTNIPLSDSEVEVRAVAAGPDGAMWLGTDSSTTQALGVRVIWLDGREASYDVISGLADNHVRDIVTGPAGDFWFATAGGLGHLAADLSWGRFTRAAGLIDDDVYALAFDLTAICGSAPTAESAFFRQRAIGRPIRWPIGLAASGCATWWWIGSATSGARPAWGPACTIETGAGRVTP